MSVRLNILALALLIPILILLQPYSTSHVSGLTCNVPIGVPNVSTALSMGCTTIVFTGDVVDTGQAIVTGSGMGYGDVVLEGNGYRLIIAPPMSPYVSMQDVPSLRIYNLEVIVGLGSGTVFNLVNTSIYLVNVSIVSSLTGTLFSQNDFNVSAYLENVNASNSGGFSTFLYQYSFPSPLDPIFPSRTIFHGVNLTGYTYALSSTLVGNYSLTDVWTDGSSFLRPYLMGVSVVEVSVENFSVISDPLDPTINPLYIWESGYNGGLTAYIHNFSVLGPFQSGILINFNTLGRVNITIHETNIADPSWSSGFGMFIFNFRGTNIAEPVYINISDSYIYGVDTGIATGNVVTWPVPLGPYEESYYSVENVYIDAVSLGISFTTTPNAKGYATILDTIISSGGYGIAYGTYDEVSLRVARTNTSSVSEGIYVFIINSLWASPRLDLETIWWFDERLSSYPYSFSIVEYPFYDGSPSVFFNISYSLIDRFDVSMGSGVLYETVYNPYGSLGSPRSIWTLNVQVLSSYTDLPVSGIRIDYWEDGVYVGSAVTGGDGNSYFTFDYIFNPADPFIQDLVFTISTSYFSGSWSYRLDFGILTTLPSWYDKIILRLPILAIKAYGMLDHIPAVMTVMGDRGIILLFADTGNMIRFLFGDRDVPYKLVHIRILDMSHHGTYIVAGAILENHLPWSQPVRMWILPGQGILRIHGPADAIFYLVGR